MPVTDQDHFAKALCSHIPSAFLLKVCAVARDPFHAFPPAAAKPLHEHLPLRQHILCIFDMIFDWCVDPRTKSYAPFTLSSSDLFGILDQIVHHPQHASTLVFVPSGILRANWLFIAHQAALLSEALKQSAKMGELHLVFKHYAAFKTHTSSPRAIALYESLSKQLSLQSRKTIKSSIDLILRGRNLARYLNPHYQEIAGCAVYVQYILHLGAKTSPLIFASNPLHKNSAMQESDNAASAVLRDLCYGRTVAKDRRVQHGFEDATHNACCLLGAQTRSGADATGNAIGKVSESVATAEPFLAASAMKPWTTCMGSAVCSNYGKKYGDAYMKFAVSPDKKLWFLPPHGTQLSPACEHYLQQDVFGGAGHRTPGVEVEEGGAGVCSASDMENILANVIEMPALGNLRSA